MTRVWSTGTCFYRTSTWYFISVVHKVLPVNCDSGAPFIEIVDTVSYSNVSTLLPVIHVCKFHGSRIKVSTCSIIIYIFGSQDIEGAKWYGPTRQLIQTHHPLSPSTHLASPRRENPGPRSNTACLRILLDRFERGGGGRDMLYILSEKKLRLNISRNVHVLCN